MDFKKTLNLPKTKFPMKANLANKEPEQLKQWEEIGLYRGQSGVLRILWEEEGVTHSELADRLHVRPATISNMVRRMEKAGFVKRQPDQEDRRVSRVYLTDAGRAIQDQVKQVWHELETATLAGFSMEERVQLRRFHLQIRDNILAMRDTLDE